MALNIATEFKKLIFLINHPVNSLYFSDSNINPNTFYGGNCGTWTRIDGYYIYAGNKSSNTSYTGLGTQSHTLTTNQIPSHQHEFHDRQIVWDANTEYDTDIVQNGSYNNKIVQLRPWGTKVGATGGGQGHTHNVATHQCCVWKRTA